MDFALLILIPCLALAWLASRSAERLSLTTRMLVLFIVAFSLAPFAFMPGFSRVDMATLMFAGAVSFTYLLSRERRRIRALRGEAKLYDVELISQLYRAFLFVAAGHAAASLYVQLTVILSGGATLWMYILAALHLLIATLSLSAQRAYRGAFIER